MAVKIFNHLPNKPANSNGSDFDILRAKVRSLLGLGAKADIKLGIKSTRIRYQDILIEVPIGLAALKNDALILNQVKMQFSQLVGPSPFPVATDIQGKPDGSNHVGMNTGAPSKPIAQVQNFDAMADEEWVAAVSENLFPGVLHLQNTNVMHQSVVGTSSGSIYRACFIGPDIRGAARIKGAQVSFRFTTPKGECPSGDVKAILERLGVSSAYSDRMTTHAKMTAPFSETNSGEYRALFGAYYAALRPYLTSGFPSILKIAEGVK